MLRAVRASMCYGRTVENAGVVTASCAVRVTSTCLLHLRNVGVVVPWCDYGDCQGRRRAVSDNVRCAAYKQRGGSRQGAHRD